jgi:RNA polymerase sigma-70 factor (ECF subfamily)
MVAQHHKNDYSIARQICKDLRADHKEAILALYHEHHHFFLAFTRRRIYHSEPDQIDTVLSNFWTELLNSKAICSYAGKAALRTFLLTILNRRIIDANRKFQRDMKFTEILDDQPINAADIPDTVKSPEDLVLQKERQKVVHDTLVRLSESAPKDAAFIRMHLNGLSYKKMAEQEFNGQDKAAGELQRKVDSIKKQFTRPVTGSLAKYKALLEENLQKNGIHPGDLMN